MNVGYSIGLLVGAAVGLVLAVALMKATKKDGSIKCKYDERQEALRGRAYRYGFFALMIGDAFLIFSDPIEGRLPFTGGAAAGAVLAVGVLVQVSYSIWKDAYISLNENRKRVMAVLAVIGLANLFIGLFAAASGASVEGGIWNWRIVNLICAALSILVLGELALKQILEGRPRKE